MIFSILLVNRLNVEIYHYLGLLGEYFFTFVFQGFLILFKKLFNQERPILSILATFILRNYLSKGMPRRLQCILFQLP